MERFRRSLVSGLYFLWILLIYIDSSASCSNNSLSSIEGECDDPPYHLGAAKVYKFKNNCYYAFKNSASRTDTKSVCCSFDAHLTWIEDKYENEFISNIMKDMGKHNIWLGSRKLHNQTIWESCHKKKTKPVADYENWEVEDFDRRRAYARLNVEKQNGSVWISECLHHVPLPVLCEKCKNGFYGKNCELKCGQCRKTSVCDPIDGSCPYGCKPGWFGVRCKTRFRCPYQGEDKLATRSNSCYYLFTRKKTFGEADRKCDAFNGHLLWLESKKEGEFISNQLLKYSPLKNSWLGATRLENGDYHWSANKKVYHNMSYSLWLRGHPTKCSKHAIIWKIDRQFVYLSVWNSTEVRPYICESCFLGHYGADCSSECGHCKYSISCDFTTGYCPGGCQKGWSGNRCKIKICTDQFYGTHCDQPCGKCKDGLTCNYRNGICENGCENGWIGNKCQHQLFTEGESIRHGNTVYTIYGIQMQKRETFSFAQKRCCDENAHLLWLETEKEEHFAATNLLERMVLPSSWLGAASFNCAYKWISCNHRKGMTYKNWYVSPSSQNASHIAVKMLKSQRTSWINIFSDIKLPYICEKCDDGFYGENCELKCSNCLNAVCDPINGHCPYGCIKGFYGRKCEIDGSKGIKFNYGNAHYLAFGGHEVRNNFHEAQSTCCKLGYHLLWLESEDEEKFIKEHLLNVIDESLVWLGAIKQRNVYSWISCSNQTVGTIELKRPNGTNCFQKHLYLSRYNSYYIDAYGSHFYLPFICEGCQPGFYGLNCSSQCGNCLNNSQCDAASGICFEGCAEGWQGEKCDTPIRDRNNQVEPTFPNGFPDFEGTNDFEFPERTYGRQNNFPPVMRNQQDLDFPQMFDDPMKYDEDLSNDDSDPNFYTEFDELPTEEPMVKGVLYPGTIYGVRRYPHPTGLIGCYKDKDERAIKGPLRTSEFMTVDRCKGFCRDNGYTYAALQFGTQCFCGNKGFSKYGTARNCNVPCPSDYRQNCGGSYANAVYKTRDLIGCFADKKERAMHKLVFINRYMTVDFCIINCKANGFPYAALQYGKQCFCGHGGYDRYGRSTNCRWACAGDFRETCGGAYANEVYAVRDSLGCFKDKEDRALKGASIESKYMTISRCKRFCYVGGFYYAALQYGKQCFCGNEGYDKYGKSLDCNKRCSGNYVKRCGGHWANEVYSVRHFIGCYIDKAERAMNAKSTSFYGMTLDYCIHYCYRHEYQFAALQNGNECFCGNKGYDKYGKTNNCDKKCPGDHKTTCGGFWAMAVFKTKDIPYFGIKDFIRNDRDLTNGLPELHFDEKGSLQVKANEEHGAKHEDILGTDHLPDKLNEVIEYLPGYAGCFKTHSDWKMESIGLYKNLTIPFCTNKCQEQGFTYAALQHGNECFCGDDSFGKHLLNSDECHKKCKGNEKTLCGGHNARSVYKVEGYVGCFKDDGKQNTMKEIDDIGNVTVVKCLKECQKGGYLYSALKSGSQCFCGEVSWGQNGTSNECIEKCKGDKNDICGGTSASSVYKVGDYIGCFTIKNDTDIISTFQSDKMTIVMCKERCKTNGTQYAGLKNSSHCVCINELSSSNVTGVCDTKCAGKALMTCGGQKALSFYKIGDYIGCFKDTATRSLIFESSDMTMTVKKCQKLCFDKGYRYAGLEFQKECYCGHGGYDKYGRAMNCNLNCFESTTIKCGGLWALSIYVTKDVS